MGIFFRFLHGRLRVGGVYRSGYRMRRSPKALEASTDQLIDRRDVDGDINEVENDNEVPTC